MQDLTSEILTAAQRIYPIARETPLQFSPYFSEAIGANVSFKLENLQHTSSFKLRGALNRCLAMSDGERKRGCVTTSWGNHGIGVAYAMHALGGKCVVFLPETVHPDRIATIRRLGGEVVAQGTDELEIDTRARAHATQNGMPYVSPYNDPMVIAGQGTIAVEMLRQNPDIDTVLAAVGGGGLISGLAIHTKAASPGTEVIGCLPENSPVMAKCVEQGRITDIPYTDTLSDGTVGNIEPDSITLPYCQTLVDRFVTVSEDEIAAAMRTFIAQEHLLLEGASGVSVASLLKLAPHLKGHTVGVVICGANISLETLKSIL